MAGSTTIPNFSINAPRGYSGGLVADLESPRVRYWPRGKARREIRVKFYTWRGASMGAVHWYAEYAMEDNPLWNRSKGRWQQCYDDKRGAGRTEKYSASSPQEAENWLIREIRQRYPDRQRYVLCPNHDKEADVLEHLGYSMQITGTQKSDKELRRLERVRKPSKHKKVVTW